MYFERDFNRLDCFSKMVIDIETILSTKKITEFPYRYNDFIVDLSSFLSISIRRSKEYCLNTLSYVKRFLLRTWNCLRSIFEERFNVSIETFFNAIDV